jgi:hypothetical protein
MIFKRTTGAGRNVEKYWLGTHYIHIWGTTQEEIDATCPFGEMGEEAEGMGINEEIHALWPYWRAMQPGWTRDADRYRENSYNSAQAICMLPVCGTDPNLNNEVGVIFPTAEDSIYNFYPHDSKQFTNYNGLIIGGSGTGKSFLVSTIAAQMKKHKARQIFIDIGGSYKNICEVMHGTYSNGSAQRLNGLILSTLAVKNRTDVIDGPSPISKVVTTPRGNLTAYKWVFGGSAPGPRQQARRTFLYFGFPTSLQTHSKEGDVLSRDWALLRAKRTIPQPCRRTHTMSFDNPFMF